jgi:hypothetical protein
MNAFITHAIKNENTKTFLFRIWSTNTKSYITDEMTEKQLRQWWIQKIVKDAIFLYFQKIDAFIERTKINGTSHMNEPRRDLKSWKKEKK